MEMNALQMNAKKDFFPQNSKIKRICILYTNGFTGQI